ncbi:MAG: hypothetical protein HY589_00510 [Candidatus Omnitrophica bacterium]|nr:hypothetical protein [Candidatus Omnitrophota bacterium]
MYVKITQMDKSYLLGLGFDCDDGHLRITRGKNFRIYGGSDKTHQLMQEKVIRFNERLDKKRKTLDDLSANEFIDMAHSAGFPIKASPKRKTNKGGPNGR